MFQQTGFPRERMAKIFQAVTHAACTGSLQLLCAMLVIWVAREGEVLAFGTRPDHPGRSF